MVEADLRGSEPLRGDVKWISHYMILIFISTIIILDYVFFFWGGGFTVFSMVFQSFTLDYNALD